MNQSIIFCDIDGTICYGRPGRIPESTIDALTQARDKGHKIFLCTGRAKAAINQEFLDLPIDGMVLCCGSHIFYDDKTIHYVPMPKKLLMPLVDELIKYDIGFSLEGTEKNYFFSEGYELFKQLHASHIEDEQEKERLLANKNMFSFDDMKDEDYDKVLKVSFYTHHVSEMERILSNLPEELNGYFDHCFPTIESGEIVVRTINKAYGIDQVVSLLDSSIDHTIAIGDGTNDLEMITHAHIGIAMGNACDELKQAADFVTKKVDEDGFAYALRHFNII